MPDRASVGTHKNGDFGAISVGTVRSNDARARRTSTKSRFSSRLDFRRLPGPVFDPPRRELFRGMSAGSFSRTAAGNRA